MSNAPKARNCAGPYPHDRGRTGDGLEQCTACNSVRCFGDDCQKARDNTHIAVCERRKSEFKATAVAWDGLMALRPECLICSLPLPFYDDDDCWYTSCCGKLICAGCMSEHVRAQFDRGSATSCPFCRQPTQTCAEEYVSRLRQRVQKNDAQAMFYLAESYNLGHGLEKDDNKAFKLYHHSAELGHSWAKLRLAHFYFEGSPIVKKDVKKAREYIKQAADQGHVPSRTILGKFDFAQHDYEAAYFNFRLAASAGHKKALEYVNRGYKDNFVSKDEFAKTLRAFQAAQDEMKSASRDKAAAIVRNVASATA